MPLSIELGSKVAPSHLGRDAYVYVRQSTLTQVREHTESLERQYELAFRAQALGWSPPQVVVIDEDLGRSGAEATCREGFKNLVADVGLGKVGIILGIEVDQLPPVRSRRQMAISRASSTRSVRRWPAICQPTMARL